jgi:hypothetical protein
MGREVNSEITPGFWRVVTVAGYDGKKETGNKKISEFGIQACVFII